MEKKNIFIIAGGGREEHEISLISAKYFQNKLNQNEFQPYIVHMNEDGELVHKNQTLNWPTQIQPYFEISGKKTPIHQILPCFHGYPGETGHFQAYLELQKIPFFGSRYEGMILSFNKVSTKLYLDRLNIPNVPFVFLQNSQQALDEANNFFKQHRNVYVKAASQGSSVGCYPVEKQQDLANAIKKAFQFSDQVLIEKTIIGRELEVAVFEYKSQLHSTPPGEIQCSNQFYSYEEKYSDDSSAQTHVVAPNLSEQTINEIRTFAEKSFKALRLKDLARVDFFLEEKTNKIYLNEINAFPGHTNISMFPQMLEHSGINYSDFLTDRLNQN